MNCIQEKIMSNKKMPLRLQKYLINSMKVKKSATVPRHPLSDAKITFIIPTIGRKTLINSVNSIKNQTVKDHNTIIIFDGIKSTLTGIHDDRFKIIEIPKKGWDNCAAYVRHQGIKLVNTKWLAFLDDDDTISKTYIQNFLEELQLHPDAHVVIFRMIGHERDNYNIIPNLETNSLEYGNVGISFVMRKDVYDLYHFEASSEEDFSMLKKLQEHGHKLVISPYITYFVKGNQVGKDATGSRVLINF